MAQKKLLQITGLALLFALISQAGLYAQSFAGGVMYSSYLPFASLYNSLHTENSETNYATTRSGFTFGAGDVLHYAPGFAVASAMAYNGLLSTVEIGVMGGPGPNNIIPNFPVRPFISASAGYKFGQGNIGFYALGGAYFDFALGEGKKGYSFVHLLGFVRGGPGLSLKAQAVEFFAQVQVGLGFQMESITLESKAGNTLYEATFLMVPVAIFPEIGIRFWS